MRIYQLQARGSLAVFGGSPKAILSKELYTAPPGGAEKSAFRERCVKCDGAQDLYSLDPDAEITISVVEMELQDNGGVLTKE